ncbi:protein kinase family protein [Grosmannia clavigera kw1407]|uniref:Protein kinase family protein n=1 Tax=Grosmannia clavigera (strain kw1407 / UAMH 11150) TaxID=655863 RepID=F0XFP0_GROCL|nr:protein kinase family protein [Grosmannia clavigera kw1407]EFX03834.1 protein kinase family protein [Grosmannia clavigera kw1407]
MEFFKSAVASAIAKGSAFPYSFGDRVDLDPSIWTLYNGTRREDGSDCSIFSFDITANKARLPLARNALKKLRTLRHPGVIKVLDTSETDTYIYIATERIVPLRWHLKRKSVSPETLKWGLFNIARTIKFINDEASSVHGSLKVSSVFTSESGEWKLGGFEVLSNVKDDEAVIYNLGSLVPDAGRYTPPELVRNGWEAIKRCNHSAVDSFNFGILLYEAFNNGDYTGTDQAGQTKGIPPTMQTGYKRLVNANPKARITVGNFLELGQRSGAFFDSPLIKLTDGIENLGVKSETEREQFLDDLSDLTDDFPEDFFKMKVLPELLKSVEFGGAGPKAFSIVMKIGTKLSNEDFDTKITPVVIRLFGNPDRAIRVCLLDSLPLMIDRLSQRTVNDKIFPQVVSGFTDLAPVVREQTLKSVLVLITKLSERTINGELLRYLAKTANDEQPGIRTNTTICLGKIAKNLGTSSRSKVLIAAFSRSMRDPFVHARNASLMALAATTEYFTPDDSALRILPAICPLLLDKEKPIRDQAFKTMEAFMHKIQKAASGMPETALPPPTATADGIERVSTPQPGGQTNGSGSAGSAGSWAGWAISSFTNKISTAAGEIGAEGLSANGAPAAKPTPPVQAAPIVSAVAAAKPAAARTLSASALHRQAVKSPPTSAPMSRDSSTSNVAAESYFAQDDSKDADAWGSMDDGFGDENGADAWDSPAADEDPFEPKAQKTTTTAANQAVSSGSGGVQPFGADDSEPDFAGWLAAQANKKGTSKPLPKGLSKTSGNANTKRPTSTRLSSTPKTASAPKKIDLKPKDTDDADDWGDGW